MQEKSATQEKEQSNSGPSLLLATLLFILMIVFVIVMGRSAYQEEQYRKDRQILTMEAAVVIQDSTIQIITTPIVLGEPAAKTSFPLTIKNINLSNWTCRSKDLEGGAKVFLCFHSGDFKEIAKAFPAAIKVRGYEGKDKSGFICDGAVIDFYQFKGKNPSLGAVRLFYVWDQLVTDDPIDEPTKMLTVTYAIDEGKFMGETFFMKAARYLRFKQRELQILKADKEDDSKIVLFPSGVMASVEYETPDLWSKFLRRI